MKKKYLLCPKCGVHVFFVKDDNDDRVLLYFDRDMNPELKEGQNAELEKLDLSEVFCLGCSWSGNVSKLQKFFNN